EIDWPFHPAAHDVLHRVAHSRHMPEQLLEGFARNDSAIEGRCRADRGIAGQVGNERGFAEDFTRTQFRERFTVALDRGFTFQDEIDLVSEFALTEDRLTGFEVLAMHGLLVKEPQLRDVARPESVEN